MKTTNNILSSVCKGDNNEEIKKLNSTQHVVHAQIDIQDILRKHFKNSDQNVNSLICSEHFTVLLLSFP
jgi:alpha-tubulin suppressor-like RCC1 family protein